MSFNINFMRVLAASMRTCTHDLLSVVQKKRVVTGD